MSENKKYILTDETKEIRGHTLHRIQAIRDFNDVKAGDLGGWVESENNLNHKGDCWVYDDAYVFKDAFVYGDATISGVSVVDSHAYISGQAVIKGKAWIYTDCVVDGNAVVENASICTSARISNNSYIKNVNDYLVVGRIGSRFDRTTFYRTKDLGIWVTCGCFNGSIKTFARKVKERHGSKSKHARVYQKAIELANIQLGDG